MGVGGIVIPIDRRAPSFMEFVDGERARQALWPNTEKNRMCLFAEPSSARIDKIDSFPDDGVIYLGNGDSV